MKIKKRDVKFFILGAMAILILELILNWNEVTEAAKRGFMEGYNDATFNWIFFF
jgi:hypothetical protein